MAEQFEQATIFGASLSATFLGSDSINVKIVTSVLIVLMSATTFLTQRQLMTKNMPASALDNPFAKQQKLLLYVLPIVFAVSGVNFPIGVLIYWFTTNVWSMCQQFYVIRRMPAPGLGGREGLPRAPGAGRASRSPGPPPPGQGGAEAGGGAEEAARLGQRQQPTSKKRKKAKAAARSRPAGGAKTNGPGTPRSPRRQVPRRPNGAATATRFAERGEAAPAARRPARARRKPAEPPTT